MARVLVGVTGGIAAYKACELVRLFVKGGHEVFPLVTPGAERFVRAETYFALARRSIYSDAGSVSFSGSTAAVPAGASVRAPASRPPPGTCSRSSR